MILLSGGTGFIGTQVRKKLLSEGFDVKLLVRDPSAEYDGVKETHEGDILDKDSLYSATENVDIVINLVGIIYETSGNTFEKIHIEGTANLVDACLDNEVDTFIQMSALGTKKEAGSRYHQSKWKAEEYLRNSGLEYCIVRPSVVFGPEDDFINRFMTMIKYFPCVPVIGSGKIQPVYVQDVADFFVGAVKNGISNKTFELGGPEKYTYGELVDSIASALNKKRLKIPVPLWLVKPAAGLMENLFEEPQITIDQLKMLREDNTTDDERWKEIINRDPLDLKTYLREFLEEKNE